MHVSASAADNTRQKEEHKRLDLVNWCVRVTKVINETLYLIPNFSHGLKKRDLNKRIRGSLL